MTETAQELAARVQRERHAHAADDVLGRSVGLKDRFPHIWSYPARRRIDAETARYLQDVRGRRVLDLGCGRGQRSLALLRRGALVSGIDLSPVYVAEARQAARSAGHPESSFAFVTGDAHTLPYAEGSFDLVVGDGILHHLDLRRALAEVHRVLTPGGRALFFEPLLDNPLLKLFRRLTPRARTVDERPLGASDLRSIKESGCWAVESSYCGLVEAPAAMLTSVLLRPFPENPILRLAHFVETRLNRFSALAPYNQYVLLNLIRL